MDEYRELLVIDYFMNKKDNYDINDIVKKLGISREKVLKLLNSLIKKGMITYKDFLLEITDEGKRFVKKNDMYYTYGKEIITNSINIKERMGIDEIYIPKKFLRKI